MKKLFLCIYLSCILSLQSIAADYFTEGKRAFNQKDYALADEYFVKALYQNPNNAQCRYYYAQTLTYLKNYEQAKIEYGYVIQLAPSTILEKYSKTSIEYINNITKNEQKNIANNSQQKTVNLSDNYIKKALTSSGELVTWDISKMPLKVYIDNKYGASDLIVNAAKRALMTWEKASNGLVKFLYIDAENYADIIITFDRMAQQSENQTLGYTSHSSNDSHINKVKIVLYTLGPNYQKLSATDIYNVALHESGHMLGIWGHSDNPEDVMYATYDTRAKDRELQLSQGDINTIVSIYEIDKNPYSNDKNSINNVLGNKHSRMNDKLKQELEYIEKIPNNPIGYINVGHSYLALEKEYEAIQYYKKALKLDSSNKDANVALAQIYTKRNDLYNAEIHYKNIMKIAPKENYAYLNLANLYLKNNKYSDAQKTMNMLFYRNSNAKNDQNAKYIMNQINNK